MLFRSPGGIAPGDGCQARFRPVALIEEEVHFGVAPAPVRVGQSRERGEDKAGRVEDVNVLREGVLGRANHSITSRVAEAMASSLKFIHARLAASDSFVWRSRITTETATQKRTTGRRM